MGTDLEDTDDSNHLDDTVSMSTKHGKRNRKRILVLALPNCTSWNILVLTSVIIDFYLTTLCFTLLPENVSDLAPIFIVFDLLYMFNTALQLLHRFWKPLSKDLPETVNTSSQVLIINLVTILPQITVLLIYFRPDYREFVLYCRLVICLRLHTLLFFRKVQRRLLQFRWVWFLAESVLYFLVILHAANTFWFLITRKYPFCTDTLSPTKDQENAHLHDSNSLVRWYFMSTYLAVQIVFNVGFGDFKASTECEMLWFIVVMLTGHFLCIIFVAVACWLMINREFHGMMYLQMVSYADKYVEHVASETRGSLRNYHQHLRENNHGVSRAPLLHLLPVTLQMDTAFDVNCGLLHRSLLLQNVPVYVQRKIALAMENVLLLPGQPIYYRNVTKKCMACVEKGVLEVLYDEDDHSPAILFRDGAILGEVSLFLNVLATATVRAAEFTEIRVLEKVNFIRIMLDYPEEMKAVRQIVAKRIDSIVEDNTSQHVASLNLKRTKAPLYETGAEKYNREYLSMYKVSKKFQPELPEGISRIVRENSAMMKIWRFFLSIIQTVLCLWYPYHAIFERYVPYDLYVFGIIADIMYFVDIMLQCTVAVKLKDKTLTKIIEIVDVRLDHWTFYFDVFSLFPIEVLAYTIQNPAERQRSYDLLKINRLLRIWRVRDLFNSFDNTANSYVARVTKNFTYASIFTYHTACLLYLSVCRNYICYEESWYHQKVIKDLRIRQHVEYGDSTLSTSLYFAVTSVFYTGLGDILPKSKEDVAFFIWLVLMCMVLKTYCISHLVSSMFLKDFCAKTYDVSFSLKTTLNYFQLPKPIKERLKRYVTSTMYLSERQGSGFIKDNTSELLQSELQISKIRNSLANMPIFKSADTYFLAMIEKEAKTFILPANEILYYCGDPTKQMFVLQCGYCNLYNADQTIEKSVGPGTQLGAIEMLAGICKKHTVIASTDCFIVTVDYRTFSKILKLFPEEYKILKDILRSQWLLRIVEKKELDFTNEEIHGIICKKFHSNALRCSYKKHLETCRSKLGVFCFVGFCLMPLTLHPYSLFLKIWCTIRCFMIVMTGVALPILIMLPPFADHLYWLTVACQCSLYLDMYILLHVAYYDNERELETRPLYTAWNYITHSFTIDFVSALPMGHISLYIDSFHSNHHIVTHLLAPHYHHCTWKLVNLVQFFRVFKLLGYMETSSWKSKRAIKIVKFVTILILLINILASLMFVITCNYEFDEDFNKNKESESFYDTASGSFYYGTIKCRNDFWLENSVFDKISGPLGLYLVSVYSVTNFLTHTGLGDITAQSSLAMTGIVLTVLIGFTLFSSLCSLTVTTMLQKVAMKIDFRKNVQLLELFLDKNAVPAGIRKKVFQHLHFIWERTRGLDYPKLLCNLNLNSPLSEDVLLSQFHSCLKCCAIFHNLDVNSLRIILKIMQLCHFKKGELIINYKDVIADIYIVSFGEVEILNADKQCIETIGIGGVFGNIRKSTRSCIRVYVKARSNLELCVIATGKLFDVIKNHPDIVRKIDAFSDQQAEYISPHNLSEFDSLKDDIRRSYFWNEIESEEDLPAKKSSLDLINPLVALQPYHFVFKVTDFLTFVTSCANIIFIPYVFVTQDRSYACYSYLLLEPIYYLRIYMKLRQGYFNFYGNVIKSNRKIVQRYFSAPVQVLWDAISNVPLSLACLAFDREEWFFFYTCLRSLHLLRIHYVLEYFKIHEEKLKFRTWLPIARLCIIYFMIIHLISCFWLMMGCPFDNCHPETWISKNKSEMLNRPPIFKMLLSYYYIISILTNTGIGDILPQTLFEITFTTIVMILGKLMVLIFIGTVLKIIYYGNFHLVRFEYKATVLRKYLQNQSLSDYQLTKIWSHVKNLWKNERGHNFPKLLDKLPYVLNCHIMTSIYGHHLRQNFLFKNTDEALLRQICSKLQRVVFFEDDYIVRCGDVNSCMYFIHRGSIAVLTKHSDFTETQHVILHANDMFGVSQGFGQGTAQHFTYRAVSAVVEVLELSFESWSFLLPHFPQDEAVILSRVKRECTRI